ncbi:MAG: hypothetical protein JSV17_00050 [Candidatus Aminicenantes bacterium]|nr:MAG: hypothetical protein JSV17_00050 [Candidatus Aminicenantes bacterium]
MKENKQSGEFLQSWKEIAVYLGCDPRTCRRWEKQLNLPVRRIGGGERPRIIAFKKDLNEWLISTGQKRTEIEKKHFFKKSAIFPILLIAGILVASLTIGWVTKVFIPQTPARFQIDNSKLVIQNNRGNTLWQYETGIENLCALQVYMNHFQYKRISEKNEARLLPHLIIKDIDADQKPEILFSTQTQNEYGEGELLCFNEDGKEMWRLKAGREMKFGTTVYSHDYRIKGFDVCDFDEDGIREILVIARHRNHYPNQIALLDPTGRIIGEYWSSGYLVDYGFFDIDDDGKTEILLGGCNNEYKKGCIVVLDPKNISGGSPQAGEYACTEFSKGTEKYYVLLPRTEVDKKESEIGAVNSIDIQKNRTFLVSMRICHLYFEFNRDFSLQTINISHNFKRKYEAIFNAQQTTPWLQDKMRKELRDKILYSDGKQWVGHPANISISQ